MIREGLTTAKKSYITLVSDFDIEPSKKERAMEQLGTMLAHLVLLLIVLGVLVSMLRVLLGGAFDPFIVLKGCMRAGVRLAESTNKGLQKAVKNTWREAGRARSPGARIALGALAAVLAIPAFGLGVAVGFCRLFR